MHIRFITQLLYLYCQITASNLLTFNYCFRPTLPSLFLLFSILYGELNKNTMDYISQCIDRALRGSYKNRICVIKSKTNVYEG